MRLTSQELGHRNDASVTATPPRTCGSAPVARRHNRSTLGADMTKRSRIHGHIVAQKTRKPVHGLHIEVRSSRAGQVSSLATTLSTADGAFDLHWPSADDSSPTKELVVSDRFGNLVATRRLRSRPVSESRRATIRVEDESLARHLSTPTAFSDRGQRLFDRHRESEITQALGMLVTPGSRHFDRLLSHVLCPGPLVPTLDDLIDVGVGGSDRRRRASRQLQRHSGGPGARRSASRSVGEDESCLARRGDERRHCAPAFSSQATPCRTRFLRS